MGGWRFLNTGFRDGATNMAIDEALLVGVERGTSRPTVRVYGWRPPAVSTGYSQDISRELDLAACKRAGVGVVRRPTGGRAVLHAGELTYSVVGRAGQPPLGSTIMETYLAVASALLAGLRELGVTAELARVPTEARRSAGGASPPCFVSSGRFEIVVGGRKLVGSAQRRVGRAVLQHGSLLMDDRHVRLAELLALPDDRARARVRRSLAAKTTDLRAILGGPLTFEKVARAVGNGFARAWRVDLDEEPLTDVERRAVEELATGYVAEG